MTILQELMPIVILKKWIFSDLSDSAFRLYCACAAYNENDFLEGYIQCKILYNLGWESDREKFDLAKQELIEKGLLKQNP